ncbi:MAG: hypothetical protein ABFS16_09350 [Bacteroidota bacterium]
MQTIMLYFEWEPNFSIGHNVAMTEILKQVQHDVNSEIFNT